MTPALTRRRPPRTAPRSTRATTLAAAAVTGAVLVGVAAAPFTTSGTVPGAVAEPFATTADAAPPTAEHRTRQDGGDLPAPRGPATVLGEADGAVPGDATVFDDEVPAVANLDLALLDALRRAATDAAGHDHVEFHVNSGWRSPAYQEQLLHAAISTYGSVTEASRWVASPQTSAHVSGDAVDIGPPRAATWLSAHGSAYGLCQIYRNEAWHYELRPEAVDGGCPAMYADPTHDPRTQR